jgi:hypothetical protein
MGLDIKRVVELVAIVLAVMLPIWILGTRDEKREKRQRGVEELGFRNSSLGGWSRL